MFAFFGEDGGGECPCPGCPHEQGDIFDSGYPRERTPLATSLRSRLPSDRTPCYIPLGRRWAPRWRKARSHCSRQKIRVSYVMWKLCSRDGATAAYEEKTPSMLHPGVQPSSDSNILMLSPSWDGFQRLRYCSEVRPAGISPQGSELKARRCHRRWKEPAGWQDCS